MASPLVSRVPQCLACIRRTTSVGDKFLLAARQQVRGKKKSRRMPNKVNAHLLRDIKGYGQQGKVMSVAAGVMRNQWYPHGLAEYATASRLKELGLKAEDILEAGMEPPTEDSASEEPSLYLDRVAGEESILETAATLETASRGVGRESAGASLDTPLSQIQAASLDSATSLESEEPAATISSKPRLGKDTVASLNPYLPEKIRFTYSRPLAAAPKKISPSLAKSAASSIKVSKSFKELQVSVTTDEIASDINKVLESRGSKASRLSPNDIVIFDGSEKSSVKHIGEYEIRIKYKDGLGSALMRKINVVAEA
ncbi:hypothetical protein BJ875DRAFT_489576 [Amylocarpus encephaloides]|uniref:Ribosomal protein L9 domain-containing protein n=1 Tax=Amylocarpus encephaloides TaxID=45428 RepID=A0A9P7Y8T3_9HELO|nr:hypothetical protein BJ875DRAFT_489576 [Amylocarpus encephaloides]